MNEFEDFQITHTGIVVIQPQRQIHASYIANH